MMEPLSEAFLETGLRCRAVRTYPGGWGATGRPVQRRIAGMLHQNLLDFHGPVIPEHPDHFLNQPFPKVNHEEIMEANIIPQLDGTIRMLPEYAERGTPIIMDFSLLSSQDQYISEKIAEKIVELQRKAQELGVMIFFCGMISQERGMCIMKGLQGTVYEDEEALFAELDPGS